MTDRAASAPKATIQTKDRKTHDITLANMRAAGKRARNYFAAAKEWSREFSTNLKPLCSGPKEDDYAEEYAKRRSLILNKFQLPPGIWFPAGGEFRADRSEAALSRIDDWVNGTLDEFGPFYDWMDEDMDIDQTYILYGVPIRQITVEDQGQLRELGEQFGMRMLLTVTESAQITKSDSPS
jgi:hypothetical protein